jgi:phosphoribosylformylglycinamidine cyclo-ligase
VAIDYKQAGVDIEAGDALVDWLQSSKNQKKDKRVISGIGGFAAMFRADFKKMKKPCLVTSTDGVGTKVLLASKFNQLEGVGQDLVAMCVNDLICVGAEPLFFLDYYACGQLDLEKAQIFLKGVRQACNAVGASLIGGETAEMPGVYQKEHFDCAGFAVGVVDEPKALGPHRVKVGDVILAVPSSGFHSNGYSLLRQVFADDIEKWQSVLMTPTALYATLVTKLKKSVKGLRACANITGGGIENIPRVLPKGTIAQLEAWKCPQPFQVVKKRSEMTWQKMLVTLNCGVGFTIIVDKKDQKKALEIIKKEFGGGWVMGEVTRATKANAKAEATVTINYDEFARLNGNP